MLPFVLFLFAAATRIQLVDEPFDIPAQDWRYVEELGLHQRVATLIASFRVQSGGAVRLLLMTRDDMERMSAAKPHEVMNSSAPALTDRLHWTVPQPGDYVLVVDNRANAAPAHVHLSV